MAKAKPNALKTPLQMIGRFLCFVETPLCGLFYFMARDIKIVWIQNILLFVIIGLPVSFAAAFIFIWIKKPWAMYNPQDFDKSVHIRYFDKPGELKATAKDIAAKEPK